MKTLPLFLLLLLVAAPAAATVVCTVTMHSVIIQTAVTMQSVIPRPRALLFAKCPGTIDHIVIKHNGTVIHDTPLPAPPAPQASEIYFDADLLPGFDYYEAEATIRDFGWLVPILMFLLSD
jgi:hypothetical protein